MAVEKIDPSKPVNAARAVILPTPYNTGPCVVLAEFPTPDADFGELVDALEDRFTVGGTTTWERPAGTGS